MAMSGRPHFSIVIPAKHEEGNIGPLLRGIQETFLDTSFEVVLAVSDADDAIVDEARSSLPDVRIVASNEEGRTAALFQGVQAALGRYVLFMDGDREHDPATARDLSDNIAETGADLVSASRYVPGGADHGRGLVKRTVAGLGRLMIWSTLPAVREHGITDPMSRFFVVRRDAIRDPERRPAAGLLPHLLTDAAIRKVVEIGYVANPRAHGHSRRSLRDRLETVLAVGRLANAQPANQRAATYGLVAMNGFAIQLMLLALFSGVIGLHPIVGLVLAIETTILMNFMYHEQVTFSGRARPGWTGRLVEYYVRSHTPAALNVTIFVVLHQVAGWHYLWAEFTALYTSSALAYGSDLVMSYPTAGRIRATARRSQAQVGRSITIGLPHNVLPTEAWEASVERAPARVEVLTAGHGGRVTRVDGQTARTRLARARADLDRLRITWSDDDRVTEEDRKSATSLWTAP